MIGAVKKHSEDKGLYLNAKNTKIMDKSVCNRQTDITVEGEVIEQVDSFEYLGSLINNKTDTTSEINRILAIANSKLEQFDKLRSGSNVATKLRVLRSCSFSVATYGCKAWTLSKNILKRIKAFENKCYRKILKVSWTEHRSNEFIYEQLCLNNGQLIRHVKKRKIKYYGHVKLE